MLADGILALSALFTTLNLAALLQALSLQLRINQLFVFNLIVVFHFRHIVSQMFLLLTSDRST